MSEDKSIMNLGSYISLVILSNKLFEQGMITEAMKNKMLTEINLDYQKIRAV